MSVKSKDERDLGAFIPSFLDDYGLTPDEFRIYARLVRRAGNGRAYESIPHMALACRISERQTRYALRLFESTGMVEAEVRKGKTTVYRLTGGSGWKPAEELDAIRAEVRRGDPSKKPKHRKKKKTPAHHAALTPAPDAGDPCTPCSPTPAPDAGQQTPAHHAAEGNHEVVKDNHEGSRCDDASASKNQNQNPDPKIDWPENLHGHEANISTIMADALVPQDDRQAFVDELAAAQAASKIKKTVEAYSIGMVSRGWRPAPSIQEGRRSLELAARAEEIRRDLAAGARILVNGKEVDASDWPVLRRGKQTCNIAQFIADGVKIETRREAA